MSLVLTWKIRSLFHGFIADLKLWLICRNPEQNILQKMWRCQAKSDNTKKVSIRFCPILYCLCQKIIFGGGRVGRGFFFIFVLNIKFSFSLLRIKPVLKEKYDKSSSQTHTLFFTFFYSLNANALMVLGSTLSPT